MSAVLWHDLECGVYRADLQLWLALADEFGAPVLDIGAGTGRVSLALARAGHPVVALDADAELLGALRERAGTLPLRTICADARDFTLDAGDRFPLCVAPMQTVQLLGGVDGRLRFLRRAHAHLRPLGTLAVAISTTVEEFSWTPGDPFPLPDMTERAGVVYASQPTAVRREAATFVLERRRETIAPDGSTTVAEDRIALDLLDAAALQSEAARVGFRPVGVRTVAATDEHVGSEVVLLRA